MKMQVIEVNLYHQDFTSTVIECDTPHQAMKQIFNDPELEDEDINIVPNRKGGWKIDGEEQIFFIQELPQ